MYFSKILALVLVLRIFKETASQMTQHINKLAFAFNCYSLCLMMLSGEWVSLFKNTGDFIIRHFAAIT